MSSALLVAEQPRVSEGGLELGSCQAAGPLLVLVGGWSPLFELFAGRRGLAGGVLRVGGAPAEAAAASGAVGLMRRDAALPPDWPLEDVVAQSALLSGEPRRRASARSREVLAELGLGSRARSQLSRLRPGERRAAGLAAALVTGAPVLALEEPFFELDVADQEWLGGLIERAVAGRPALVSLPGLPGGASENALAARADELLVMSEGRLAARGTYRELQQGARSYRVIVQRSVDALLSRLDEAGYEVRRMLAAGSTTLLVTDRQGTGTVPLLRASLAADAPIIELCAVGLGEAAPSETSGEPLPAGA